jgi:hypothetical protein
MRQETPQMSSQNLMAHRGAHSRIWLYAVFPYSQEDRLCRIAPNLEVNSKFFHTSFNLMSLRFEVSLMQV